MRIVLMRINLFFIAIMFSLTASCSDPKKEEFLGSWSYESIEESYSISISEGDSNYYMEYCFIIDNGNKIYCPEQKFKEVEKTKECLTFNVYDDHLEQFFLAQICKNERGLSWFHTSPHTNIPKKINLKKDS